MGMGSSARFEISEKIIAKLQQGKELAEVMDELTGKTDVRSTDVPTHTTLFLFFFSRLSLLILWLEKNAGSNGRCHQRLLEARCGVFTWSVVCIRTVCFRLQILGVKGSKRKKHCS
jgi:hypothetical protein